MDQVPLPIGRGHRKTRKKGARHLLFRRKNEARLRQEISKESNDFTLKDVAIPANWHTCVGHSSVEYCQLMKDVNGMPQVSKRVRVYNNYSWSVLVQDHKVDDSCDVLSHFPQTFETSNQISMVVKSVDRAFICPGNPDQRFVDVCQSKGGTISGQSGNGDTVAFIDKHGVIDSRGQSYPCTVRRVDCDFLCSPSAQCPQRCRSCQVLRTTLRSSISRSTNTSDARTNPSSHTQYRSLSVCEKDIRLRNLHCSLRVLKQRICRLEARLERLTESEGLSLREDDVDDLSVIFQDVSSTVNERYPPDSPQRVFWDQQMKYNSLNHKRQMKWHPLVVRFALNLKYISSTAYRALRQGGIINLPSERTLSDYTHWASVHNGVQIEFIEHFKSMLENEVAPSDLRLCAISMDEMKIKSGLVFSKTSGHLVGFVDLGSVNREIEQLIEDVAYSTNGRLAEQMLVFMARGVFKPSLAVPVAHYPSLKLSGEGAKLMFCCNWVISAAKNLSSTTTNYENFKNE